MTNIPLSLRAQATESELEMIRAAVPDRASVQPKQPRRLFVFSRAWGYKHTSIPYGKAAVRIMAEKTGAFEVTISDDDALFEPQNLGQFDAILFNNTNNEIFLPENFAELSPEEQDKARQRDALLKKSLVDFLSSGKGLAVIHAGVASFRQWPEYGRIIGARFDNHPWVAGSTVTLKIEDPEHPLAEAFHGSHFVITDEIYQFKDPYRRDQLRVLFSVDTDRVDISQVSNIHRTDGDFALSWVKMYGKGRVFYSALGHQHDIFWNPTVLRSYLDGIQFALGDLKASTEPIPAGSSK